MMRFTDRLPIRVDLTGEDHGVCGESHQTQCFGERLSEVAPRGIVDNDGLTVGESLDRMADVTWHDRDHTRPSDLSHAVDDLSHAVDGHLESALDHLMMVPVNMSEQPLIRDIVFCYRHTN